MHKSKANNNNFIVGVPCECEHVTWFLFSEQLRLSNCNFTISNPIYVCRLQIITITTHEYAMKIIDALEIYAILIDFIRKLFSYDTESATVCN